VIPAEEIDRRIGRLQEALGADGLDGAVIVQHTDLAYFTGTNQQAHLVVPAAGEPVLLVRRVLDRARAESPLRAIEPIASLSELDGRLAERWLGAGTRLGFELDVLPAARFRSYQARLADRTLDDCSPQVRAVRSVKSPWERDVRFRARTHVWAWATR